ncbi:hypothetical protein HaLaN_27548, partial [Haematococcus lacustris]
MLLRSKGHGVVAQQGPDVVAQQGHNVAAQQGSDALIPLLRSKVALYTLAAQPNMEGGGTSRADRYISATAQHSATAVTLPTCNAIDLQGRRLKTKGDTLERGAREQAGKQQPSLNVSAKLQNTALVGGQPPGKPLELSALYSGHHQLIAQIG